jgi:hypothetical protein
VTWALVLPVCSSTQRAVHTPPVGGALLQGPPEGLWLLFVQQSPLIPSRVVAVLIDEPLGSLGVVACRPSSG